MPPSGWDGLRRVLAVRLDNVGDVVMLGPALRALKRAMPATALTLMASAAGSEVAAALPWIDNLLTTRAVWQDASGAMALDPTRELALVDRIRGARFDAALIFTSFSQSPWPAAYACYLAGVPRRVGQSKEFGGTLLTDWTRPGPDWVHQVDRNLSLIEAVGFEPAGRELELQIDCESRERASRLLAGAGVNEGQPFVVVAPRASCAARTYPFDRFLDVIAALPGAARLPVVVVGSPRDRGTIDPALAGIRDVRSLVGRTSVMELAAIMARAALAVVNNSGPLHIADAFRVPMVVLYSGSEHAEQWRPRASRARLLGRATDCSPCYRFTCPYAMECLDIAPSEVVRHSVEVLEECGVLA